MDTKLSRPAGHIPGDLDQPAGENVGHHALSASTARQVPLTVEARPYPPSWIDKLTDWVGRLPVPAWAFYLALGLVLALLLVSIAWVGGALSSDLVLGAFALDYFLSAMTFVYLLALVHYLDNSAAAALARFRPVMAVNDAEYNRLSYQLTTLPARPTLIASVLGAAYVLGTLVVRHPY